MTQIKRKLQILIILLLALSSPFVFAFTISNSSGSVVLSTQNPPIAPTPKITVFPPPNIPELLGWVPLTNCKTVCCGYYKDPLAPYATQVLPPAGTTAVLVNAQQSSFSQTGTSILIGNVTFVQPGRIISADQATLNRDSTGQASTADLNGQVVLREPGKLVIGQSGHIDFQTKLMSIYHAIYHYALSATKPFAVSGVKNLSSPTAPTPIITNNDNALPPPPNAWGIAYNVAEVQKNVVVLTKATYTTCAPTENTWRISAGKIILNENTGRGVAYNMWLDVKGIPIFYSPYFNFPIQKKRKTGFLFPAVSHTSNGGYSFGLPFYWNLAPNYDATITPIIYSKRGFQADANFRYLFPWSNGEFSGGFLPYDGSFAEFQQDAKTDFAGNDALGRLLNSSDSRGYFSWQNSATYDVHWKSSINYNYVTDDYYIEDFDMPKTLVSNQLPQQANLSYSGEIWNFLAKIQNFETLHPVNQTVVNNTYESLPELDLNAFLPDQDYGLDYRLNDQFIFFQRSANPGETSITNVGLNDGTPPGAGRFNINPSISLPITGLPGYFTPTIAFEDTYYSINDQAVGYNNQINRALPIIDVDTGLYFDRDFSWFNNEYQQTLEPRLFYLYVPYRNQTDIPLFDSALVPFGYNALFLTNRFSGLDRLGDANQISYSLTSKFLDEETGAQKLSVSLGQIFYFENRLVSTCNQTGTPGAVSSDSVCTNALALVGATSTTERFSPFAGQATYNFNHGWTATANEAWDPTEHRTISGNVNLQYMPETNKIINFNYNFLSFGNQPVLEPGGQPDESVSSKNNLNTLGTSLAWPVPYSNRWQVVGGWNYDLAHHYPQTYLYGLQYSSCCWAVRAVAGRTFIGLNENNNPMFNNGFYLQWQFTGLGTVGNADPASLLVGNIPGYQDVFDNYSALKELTL